MRSAFRPDESRPRSSRAFLRSPTFIFLMSALVREDIGDDGGGRGEKEGV